METTIKFDSNLYEIPDSIINGIVHSVGDKAFTEPNTGQFLGVVKKQYFYTENFDDITKNVNLMVVYFIDYEETEEIKVQVLDRFDTLAFVDQMKGKFGNEEIEAIRQFVMNN